MAASLALYRIVRLPRSGEVRAVEPRGSGTRATRPAATGMEITRRTAAKGWSEAFIRHEERVEMMAVWRNKVVDEVLALHDLRALYKRDGRTEGGLFAVEAPRHLAKAVVDRLNKRSAKQVELESIELDLEKLLSQFPKKGASVLGAWSTADESSGIRSRAVFGDDLLAQPEFRRMRSSGEISSLGLTYPFARRRIRLNLSRRSSAVFFGDVDIEARLQLMERLVTAFAGPKRAAASG
jgi:hypothetical protein